MGSNARTTLQRVLPAKITKLAKMEVNPPEKEVIVHVTVQSGMKAAIVRPLRNVPRERMVRSVQMEGLQRAQLENVPAYVP